MKKTLLQSLVMLMSSTVLFAQETPLKREKELIITAGPTASKLLNSNVDKDEYKGVHNQGNFNLNFSYNRYYKNRFGFGIGIGYSGYKQTVDQKGLFEKSNMVDKDANDYDLWMNSNLTYTTNLKYVDVPITLHLLLGNSKKFYGFIDAGIVNGFLISGKNSIKGSTESIGKYPTNNPYFSTISQGNSYYGYKMQPYDKEYTDSYKFYNLSFRASFGIAAAITDNLYLRIAPEITKGLSDINSKDNKGVDYENVFGEKSAYKATKTFSLGLNVGFSLNI